MEKAELLSSLQEALDALERANLQNTSLMNALEETQADATFLAVGYDDLKAQIEVCSFCLSLTILLLMATTNNNNKLKFKNTTIKINLYSAVFNLVILVHEKI